MTPKEARDLIAESGGVKEFVHKLRERRLERLTEWDRRNHLAGTDEVRPGIPQYAPETIAGVTA